MSDLLYECNVSDWLSADVGGFDKASYGDVCECDAASAVPISGMKTECSQGSRI